jgi:transcriptional regulator with XRE-family HTH domain
MTTQPVATVTGPSFFLAEELRAELGRQSMSFSAMSRRLGVSVQWVQRRISMAADVDMTLEELDSMADVLGVDPELLVIRALRARRDSNPKPSDLSMTPFLSVLPGGAKAEPGVVPTGVQAPLLALISA